MNVTINIAINQKPTTCFDCDFATKKYCWAKCPFLQTVCEDTEPLPKNCPLKEKNKNKIYQYSIDKNF